MINFPANDPPVEAYINTRAEPPCENLRWWVNDKLMGGGSVVSQEDWNHLLRDFGITRCLNIDTKSDAGLVPASELLEVPIADNGMAIAAPLLSQACRFATEVFRAGGKLYVHSGNGGARAPAVIYAILRACFGNSHEESLIAVNKGFPHSDGFHFGYLDGHRCAIGSVDLWIDEGGLGA